MGRDDVNKATSWMMEGGLTFRTPCSIHPFDALRDKEAVSDVGADVKVVYIHDLKHLSGEFPFPRRRS